jgi:hypothetical protein
MDAVKKKVQQCCDSELHTEHLCYLLSQGFNLEDAAAYMALVENPRFRCRHCGRTAAGHGNLCLPVLL